MFCIVLGLLNSILSLVHRWTMMDGYTCMHIHSTGNIFKTGGLFLGFKICLNSFWSFWRLLAPETILLYSVTPRHSTVREDPVRV